MEKKKRHWNRILSLLLACVMLFQAPMSAFAFDGIQIDSIEVSEDPQLTVVDDALLNGETESEWLEEEFSEISENETAAPVLEEAETVAGNTAEKETGTETGNTAEKETGLETENAAVTEDGAGYDIERMAEELPEEFLAEMESEEISADILDAETADTEEIADMEETEAETADAELSAEETETLTIEDSMEAAVLENGQTEASEEENGSGLNFQVTDPDGYVTVGFVDNGIRPEDAEIDNMELYGTALGTVIEAVEVPFVKGDSIADVTVRLLDALGMEYEFTGTVDSGFYLAALKNFELNGTYYPTLGEFDGGKDSGWCVRLNNWHIDRSAAEIEVGDEDVVSWLYTCQLGADIGADYSNPSAKITGVKLADDSLALIQNETTGNYTCEVPFKTRNLAFEIELDNYASVITVTVDGREVNYRPNKAITVRSTSTIVISTRLEYMDAENNNEITVYRDYKTIQLTEKPNNAPTVKEDAAAELTVKERTEQSVDLGALFEDADGDALTYHVKAEGLGMDQDVDGSVFTFQAETPGAYEVILTATDGKDAAEHKLVLTVTKNTAPSLKSDYAETKGKSYLYASSYVYIYMKDIFEDADGDALTYSATLNGEPVDITYNSWSKEYYILFNAKPAVYEYKIKAFDGLDWSEEFTAKCIGTSATISAPEGSPLIPYSNANFYYYILGTAKENTFALDYKLDVDETLPDKIEWYSGDTSVLTSNGDGTFTVGEITSRKQVMAALTCGKDSWNSTVYLGTKYFYIIPAMPEIKDVTLALPEHEDNVKATTVSNAVSGGLYTNEFDFTVENPQIASIAQSGTNNLSITPRSLGSTTVTAAFKYDPSIQCSFTVTVTGRSLQIHDRPGEDSVIYGEDETVQMIVLGAEDEETFTWTTSDPAVAEIDSTGLVTVKGKGQTYITAVSSLSTEEAPLKASMYLQVKEKGKVYLDDIAVSSYSYFEGFISEKSGFNSAQLEYDWNLLENRYTYSTLAFTPYFKDETLKAVLHYQVSGGEYQTMELKNGTAVSIANGLNPGENTVTIDVYPAEDETNVTTYTFHIYRPYNPTNTITFVGIYPNGDTALAYPTYMKNKEGTLFQCDAETHEPIVNRWGNYSTSWSSSVSDYKTYVFGARTASVSVYPRFGYENERVMIYVNGEQFEEAVTNWKSKIIPIDSEKETVISFRVNSEKYQAEQLAAGVEDPFENPEKVYNIYVECVDPLGIDSKILSAEIVGGEFYRPGFDSDTYTISALVPAGTNTADLKFTVASGIDVYKTSAAAANKLEPVGQDEEGNNLYETPIVTITGSGSSAYSTTNIILQVTDTEGNVGNTQYAFTVNRRGAKDIYPDSILEYLCLGSQYTNLSSYGTMPERTLKENGGVLSLGSFGGYIVYKYDTPIENNPNNPYGVDFIVYGNPFGYGAHEPGYVQVSQDGQTWYTMAGSDHYEDHNDWDYTITYTNNNGASAWTASDGASGTNYNYPVASAYPYYNWTEALEQSITASGYRLDAGTSADAYGSLAAVFTDFGYVDVNTNGTINGVSINPYDHPGTLVGGGDQFDLDWAVDASGMPVQLDSISYIRIATASSIYAGAIGEKSTEVTAVNRVTNTAGSAVGATAVPETILVNGVEITVPANGSAQTVSIPPVSQNSEETEQAAALTVSVNASEEANIYINNKNGALRSYTSIPDKGIIRIIVQEGEKEPYICYLKLRVVETAVTDAEALIDAIGDVTLGSAQEIAAARTAYDALTAEEKAKVNNFGVLTAAEAELKSLQEAAAAQKKEEEAQKKADACAEKINALPSLTQLKTSDKARIAAARAAYNALTAEEKAKVSAAVLQKLMAAEEKLAQLEKESESSTHEHKWDAGTVTKKATCTQTGVKTYKCSCGASKTEKLAKVSHSYGSWSVKSKATVLKAKVIKRTCSVCGHVQTKTSGKALTPTIKVNVSSLKLQVKQTTTVLKVSGLARGDSVKSYKSSDKSVFVVNAKSGKVRAKGVGSAKLTITLASGLTKKITVKVQKEKVKTTKITGISSKITLKKGKSQKLKPVLTPLTSQQKITYKSSDPAVVKVSAGGKLTAKKSGTAKITVKSGSITKTCKVTVK